MKTIFNLLLILALAFATRAAQAQDEIAPPMVEAPSTVTTFSTAQLDQLTGPVALYPDPLIAILLPAATQPSQIVQADRYVQNGGDPNAVDQEPWDTNVQALVHYPDVLKWMDDNLAWTTQLGEAFANQQPEVMDSVQRLRTQAYNLGNLASTPQQQVLNDGGYIEIIPTSPTYVYVPDYQPAQVYYQQPYGAPYITFSAGFIIGPWLCGDFDWHDHHLIIWSAGHPRPRNWWHERPQQRALYISKQTSEWHPDNHPVSPAGNHIGTNPHSNFQWNNPNPNQGQGSHNFNVPNQRTQTAPVLNRPAPPPNQWSNTPHPQNQTPGVLNPPGQQHDTRNFNDPNRNRTWQNQTPATPISPPPRINNNNGTGAYHTTGNSGGGAYHTTGGNSGGGNNAGSSAGTAHSSSGSDGNAGSSSTGTSHNSGSSSGTPRSNSGSGGSSSTTGSSSDKSSHSTGGSNSGSNSSNNSSGNNPRPGH